jgi:hypothetical protein
VPTEFRRITFSHEELRHALGEYQASKNNSMPSGDINSIKSTLESQDIVYEVTLFDYSKRKESSLMVKRSDSLDALIDHCLDTGIALPRLARKETRDIENRMCLEIFLE